jgi:hypothetical protein
MKKTFLILLVGFILVSCGASKQKNSYTLGLFANLEQRKCTNGEINGYLLRSGTFESKGSRNGIRTFQTFAKYKDVVTINTYDYADKYYLATNNSDIYNFLIKNGTYLDTATDSNGNTNLKYSWNNNNFYLHKEEPSFGGRIYYITSSCN